MPFRRSRFRRKFRKFGSKKARTNRKFARVGTVKRMLAKGVEMKVFHQDLYTNFGGALTGPIIRSTAGEIVQGLQDGERVGDRIILKKLDLLWCVSLQQNTAVSADANAQIIWRMIVFTWKPESMDSGSGGVITGDDVCGGVLEPYSWDNRQQYKILMDTGPRYLIWADAPGSNPKTVSTGKRRLFMKNQLQYQPTAGSATNNVYVWIDANLVTTEVDFTPPEVLFNVTAQSYYTDS